MRVARAWRVDFRIERAKEGRDDGHTQCTQTRLQGEYFILVAAHQPTRSGADPDQSCPYALTPGGRITRPYPRCTQRSYPIRVPNTRK